MGRRSSPQRIIKFGSRAAAFTRGSHARQILVVDDEPIIRELLRQVLEGDFEVLEAPDGPTALALLGSHRVDLILLDVLLPGMSGIEVLSRVRAIRPKTPVILISGAATVPTAVTAMKLGAVDCLIKPFSNAELLTRVRGVLAGRPSPPSAHQSNRPLLLVGTDLGVVATLHVAISTRMPVSSAWTLAEASEKITSQSYGAIVLDDSLTPVQSLGFLRAAHPRVASSSIIVLSSHPERWTSSEFVAVGINTIIAKPFHLNDLMDHLAAACIVEREQPAKARFNPVMSRALDHFRDHFVSTLTMPSVARVIGVSPGHLASSFRADLGMTPRQFVARVRIEITKQLLLNTEMKIDAIADAVGFNDASHLSRVFKRYVKLRPGQYRR